MPYLVFDLEMTGTEPGWHEIIQIGAVLFDDEWYELGRYLENVYPENEESYSLVSQEVHGLTLEELEDAPMLSEVLPDFENWIIDEMGWNAQIEHGTPKHKLMKQIILCGQSVVNDINFLKFAYRQEKMDWPFSFRMLDLQSLAYFVFRVLRNSGEKVPTKYNLDAIAGYFGLERETGEHNALEDAELTADCLIEVFNLGDKMKFEKLKS